MNPGEAKATLLLHRPGTADADDPQIVEALAVAQREPVLARWLEEHSARQDALRAKFRQISAPAGLKEQIISERAALARRISQRRKSVAVGITTVVFMTLVGVAALLLPRPQARPPLNTLVNYQSQMVGFALSPYGMALATNDLEQIRSFLARGHAPADYTLPAPLEKVAASGCTVKYWAGTRIAMICFRTGKPLPPGRPGDLWLFVTDRTAVRGAPVSPAPQFAQFAQIVTATWARNGKLYLLATEGDEQTIRKYL